MDANQLPPIPNQPPAEDQWLENLASVTGLFNPEVIWQEEEQLDDLEQQSPQEVSEPTEAE